VSLGKHQIRCLSKQYYIGFRTLRRLDLMIKMVIAYFQNDKTLLCGSVIS